MKKNIKILVIDEETEKYLDILEDDFITIEYVSSEQDAINMVEHEAYDMVIIHPTTDTVQEKSFVRYIKKEIPRAFVILIDVKKSAVIDDMISIGLCDSFISTKDIPSFKKQFHDMIEGFEAVQKNDLLQAAFKDQNDGISRHIDYLSQLDKAEKQNGNILTALLDASHTINVSLDLDTILNSIVDIASSTLRCKNVSLMLVDKDDQHLSVRVAVGLSKQAIKNARIPIGEGIAGWVVSKGQPLLVKDIEKDSRFSKMRNKKYESKSLVCVPLLIKGEVIGAFSACDKNGGSPFYESDLQVLTLLAHQVAMSIENTRLYSEIQDHYFNTVKALTMTIEAKDPYTQGHSARVTDYAVALAEHLRISKTDIDILRRACNLHDIGKIAVSETILLKKGKLSLEEFEIIKKHPVAGENILKPISFLEKERKVIRHHHERYDGQGYPDGISKKKIPLLSRIIAITDAYDAMTSDRSYRPAMTHEEAMLEIVNGSNTQFDPDIVGPFVEIIDVIRPDQKTTSFMGLYSRMSRKPVHQVKVIAITSGKGGVGKTNLAVNLGLALCQLGKRVVLIDADLGLANVDVLFGLTPQYNIQHVLSGQKDVLDIMIEGPLGLNILPASSGIEELTSLDTLQQKIFLEHFEKVRKHVDYVLIDTEAGLGKNAINFNLAADDVFVVCTPEPTSTIDAYAMIKTLLAHNNDVNIKLVLNMVKNEKEAQKLGQKMITITKQFLNRGISMEGFIVRDEAVPKSVKRQRPFYLEFPYSRATECIRTMAYKISGQKRDLKSNVGYEENMKKALYRLASIVS